MPKLARHLRTVPDVAALLGIHQRTVWRRIKAREFVDVKLSPHRLYIDAERTRIPWGMSDLTILEIEGEERKRLKRDRERERRRRGILERQRQQRIADGVQFLVGRHNGSPLDIDDALSVRQVARISRKHPQEVYRDLTKGALKKYEWLVPNRRTRVFTTWVDAIPYVNTRAERAEILRVVVRRFFHELDPMVRDQIAEGFVAWLARSR